MTENKIAAGVASLLLGRDLPLLEQLVNVDDDLHWFAHLLLRPSPCITELRLTLCDFVECLIRGFS